MKTFNLDRHGAVAEVGSSTYPPRSASATRHYHVTCAGRKTATVRHPKTADRIASNYSIRHPEHQVHVTPCDGGCRG